MEEIFPDKTYTVSQAFQYCLNLARSHYENFPVASMAIPKKYRPHIAAVYAFSRIADDFADEPQFDGRRMVLLKDWEDLLNQMDKETPTHPVFLALSETIKEFNIPKIYFLNLLKAFKMDVVVKNYQNFDAVLNYCSYSANPVGRIILTIMGFTSPRFLECSDSICTGLQLANFWQDVAIDLKKDRIYLPIDDLHAFGYTVPELQEKIYNSAFKRLMYFQVERTQEIFEKGKFLCSKIPGRFGMELKLTWLGGMKILSKIKEADYDVFTKRPKLSKLDYLSLIWNACQKKTFTMESPLVGPPINEI